VVLYLIEIYTSAFNGINFVVAIDQQEVVASSFDKKLETALNKILGNLPFDVPFQVFANPSNQVRTILSILKEIYEGKKNDVKTPLAYHNFSLYSIKVLKTTISIPVGYVTSYGAVAKAVGGGSRVVGNVMAKNPFPPFVPCHRVVKSDFSLGDYGLGGSKIKFEFLSREKQGYLKPIMVNASGASLEVFPVEQVLRKYN